MSNIMRFLTKVVSPNLQASSSGSLHSQQSANGGITPIDSPKLDPNHLIILVMGPTGSGKTNFINKLTRNPEDPKASGLTSDTQNVTTYPIEVKGRHLVLVDTPGFDDTYRLDIVILRMIADWLIQDYPDGTTLKMRPNIAGIIYLHKINENRFSGSAGKNLRLFAGICGSGPLPRTSLVTTMWDTMLDEKPAVTRENELKGKFWRELIDGGATVEQFRNSSDSAWEIIDDLLRTGKGDDALLIQEELDGGKHLTETQASKTLYAELQKRLSEHAQILKELAEEEKRQKNSAMIMYLRGKRDEIEGKIRETQENMDGLKVPFYRRLWRTMTDRKNITQKSIQLNGF